MFMLPVTLRITILTPFLSEDIHIKSSIHIYNLGELVDSGSGKKTDAEFELKTAENLEKNDCKHQKHRDSDRFSSS